ncbi:MAG: chemotaxis protein CheA [Syntrophomonadaceae bacterium]|nr:chemotaxis protein CheA [Syntrophomonadaceae bacterium]
MDMSQYLDIFLEESKEHLGNLNQKLLDLEKNSGDMSALNEIFRAAHTLKGMSSTMGFEDLADLTHHMEDVLVDFKEGVLQVDPISTDAIFKCFDRIQTIIEQIETGGNGEIDNSDLIYILQSIKSGTTNSLNTEMINCEVVDDSVSDVLTENAEPTFQFSDYDLTVLREANTRGFKVLNLRIEVAPDSLMKSVRAFMVFKAIEEDSEIIKSNPSAQELEEGKFDNYFDILIISKTDSQSIIKRLESISEIKVQSLTEIQVESLTVAREPVKTEAASISEADNLVGNKKVGKIKQTVRVDIDRLDSLMNLVGELVMHKGRLEQIGATEKITELNETIEQIDRISGDLQSVVMKVRMVPIEQVFNRFPRMVRDLSKDLNKEIDFLMEGKETELDRTVIDEIGDPLIHLLRNAIDHGIELPSERVKSGKPAKGTLMLRARHEGNNVYIEVEDDGAGINPERIIQKAVDKGLIGEREAEGFSREEAIELLFAPGFSTADQVTDVSGRGVGLDVVKNKIEALNGEINVDSKLGTGTKFKIKLPLTLAIIQALMISVRNEIYAIPLSSVDETTIITEADIKMVQNQEVIMLRGNVLPLYRLGKLLEVPDEAANDDMYVVVVRRADKQIGLVVDSLIGQQEIVIKSLGKLLAGVPGIAGAIVAGDGNVRLILDIATLF